MRRGAALLLLIVVIAAAAALWIAYSGRTFLLTRDVVLPEAVAGQEGSGTSYYTTRFDDGYLNASSSEAKLGTAQVTLALETAPAGQDSYGVVLQLWHAEKTRVTDLSITLRPPLGSQLLYELPSGDGWGPMLHTVNLEGTTVELPRLGWGNEGYTGTIWLRFASYPGATGTPEDTLKADVEFHMYPAEFPRLTQWHVRGSFELPTATPTSP